MKEWPKSKHNRRWRRWMARKGPLYYLKWGKPRTVRLKSYWATAEWVHSGWAGV
jgi:hypothetical protein